MTWLEIRPQDVWLFRDGKPFSAGEDHSAHSMFPPTPLTVQGALRQKVSVSLGVSLRDYIEGRTALAAQAAEYIGPYGEVVETGRFRMTGPFIGLHVGEAVVPLFPCPADLLRYEKPTKPPVCVPDEFYGDFVITAPDLDSTVSSDLGDARVFPRVIPNYENLPDYWMTGEIFDQYLAGNVPDKSVFLSRDKGKSQESYAHLDEAYAAGKRIWHKSWVYENENRFGVSTNALTSFRDEGLLYQVGFVRPQKDIGLLVDVQGIPETALLIGQTPMGGEHRLAHISVAENITMPTAPPQSIGGRFKVIFLTPAYLGDGWLPSEDVESWNGWFRDFLVSAALYRPLKIGGWNTAARKPRTMHNYIAPGSVYYFDTPEAVNLPPALTENPDQINDAAAIGFGQYVVSQW
ncbi:MAG: type III-B CRISPR module-associated protein Cmr3 [Anaerolineae bacterium]|nr:type III-B CRISPR module-associated protein Cmr3 [Anaerolineae bacterium]